MTKIKYMITIPGEESSKTLRAKIETAIKSVAPEADVFCLSVMMEKSMGNALRRSKQRFGRAYKKAKTVEDHDN